MHTKKNTWKTVILLLTLAVVLSFTTIVVYAYYMSRVYLFTDTVGEKQIFRVGMELNTFFDQINSGTTEASSDTPAVTKYTPLGIECTDVNVVKKTRNGDGDLVDDYTEETVSGATYYTNKTSKLCVKATTVGTETTYEYVFNPDCDWGGASNPYLISRINHLQNLYVLQNLGFFNSYYANNGTETMTEENLPYFLVCTSLGTPATIDGTGMTFEHIGNGTNPFIGYVGGAFNTTASDGTTARTTTVDGKSADQSVIYNLTVKTDKDVPDVGLFGHIGYLGTLPDDASEGKTFDGAVSTVRDLLLYDVKVEVKEKTLWHAIVDKIAHLFTFSDTADADINTVPHETHHVGILAGHVEYATIEYISVYYSDDSIAAINVDMTSKSDNDVSANFYSVTGILGFVVGMNSDMADGKVTIGGMNNEDVGMTASGEGTGGGTASGIGRGYVTAVEIFNQYKASGKLVKVTTQDAHGDEVIYYGMLFQLHGSAVASYYYGGEDHDTNLVFTDGTGARYSSDFSYVSTFAEYRTTLNVKQSEEEKWYNFVVHDLTTSDASKEYFYFTGSTWDTRVFATQEQIEVVGISLKYAAKLVAASEGNPAHFESLCTQYFRDRIGSAITGTQKTNRYYFYDGVFTFSLSQATDTVEPTWYNDAPSVITVGADDSDAWTQDESGLPDSVVAFLKPVKSAADIVLGKSYYIAYKDGDSYHIVTLANNSTYTSGQGDNAVLTAKTTLSTVSSTEKSSITASLNAGTLTLDSGSGTTLQDLKNNWSDIVVLDLGNVDASMSLDVLRTKYQVTLERTAIDDQGGPYEDDGETLATTALQNNAKATVNIAGTYYTITSVTDVTTPTTVAYDDQNNPSIVPSDAYGEGFTLFTLATNATATVNLANVQTAITNQNDRYYTPDKYDVIDGSPSYIRLKSGATAVDYTDLYNAISALNGNVYHPDDVTVKTVGGVSYFVVKSGKTAVNLTAAQNAINSLNATYYTYASITEQSGSPTYFTLKSSPTTANLTNIWSAIQSYNSNYYKDDESTVLNATLKSNLSSLTSGYTDTRTFTVNTFYYFTATKGNQSISNWLGDCIFKLYKVTNGSAGSSVLNTTSISWGSLSASDAETKIKNLFSATSVEDGFTFGTFNNEKLPVLYLIRNDSSSNYYASWKRDTGSSSFISGSSQVSGITSSNLQFTMQRTQTINFVYKSYTGSGVVYTWNDLTTTCSAPTRQKTASNANATLSNTMQWDDKTLYSNDYNLYTVSGKGSNAVLIVRYVYDGIILETLGDSGITYSLINGSGTKIADVTGTITAQSGKTLTDTGGVVHPIYKTENGKLGVRVAKFNVTSILTKTYTGSGITYSSGTSAVSGTGNKLTVGTQQFDILFSGGKLGILVSKMNLDGVLLQTSSGTGISSSYINASKVSQGAISGAITASELTLTTAGGKTYTVSLQGGKFGVVLGKIQVDGIMRQTQTGTGVTYSLINGSGSTLSGTIGPNFTPTGNYVTDANGNTHQLWISGGKIGVRVANIALDGYVTANVSSAGTSYTLNGGSTWSPEPTQLLSGTDSVTYYATVPLSNGTTTKYYNLYVANGKLLIKLIHFDLSDQPYYYQFSHASSTADDPYYLRILRREYIDGYKYGMIVSTDSNLTNLSQFGTWIVPCRSVADSTDCTVIINGDGTVYLQYTVGGTTRYLSYYASGNAFSSSSSQNANSRLYLFTAEGTHDASSGKYVIPVADKTVTTVNASEYVLWPNNTYLATGDTNTDSANLYNPANGYMLDTTYSIQSLETLYNSGWRNKDGKKLTLTDLKAVFSLGTGISQVSMLNLWGGNTGTDFGADNYVKAPIGTTGEEAYIPTGCVAFRVNKTLATNRVRVIVAVPISDFYYGQTGNDIDYTQDYSFCMWQVEEANDTDSYSISIDNCVQAFELPRSTPYNPDTADNDYIIGDKNSGAACVKKYVQVTMGGKSYRTYLNGNQVLVAYEFDAKDEGVYLLGSTKECRIVYFSADSAASTGKDGVTSYKIGTIDYVYDDGNYTVAADGTVKGDEGDRVITVRDTNKGAVAVDDYSQYYYASLLLLYTDNSLKTSSVQSGDSDTTNGFPNINNFVLYVRRVATHTKTANETTTPGYATVVWQAKNYVDSAGSTQTHDAAYLGSYQYATLSDPITRRDNGTIVRESDGE